MQTASMARDDWFYIQQQKKLVESVIKELDQDTELKQLNIRDIKQFTEYQFREYIKSRKNQKKNSE